MEQGQSDSGSRLADDLLAGLESSEPRQLKWSLKLEPMCNGGEEGASEGGGRGEACTSLLYGVGGSMYILLSGSIVKVT